MFRLGVLALFTGTSCTTRCLEAYEELDSETLDTAWDHVAEYDGLEVVSSIDGPLGWTLRPQREGLEVYRGFTNRCRTRRLSISSPLIVDGAGPGVGQLFLEGNQPVGAWYGSEPTGSGLEQRLVETIETHLAEPMNTLVEVSLKLDMRTGEGFFDFHFQDDSLEAEGPRQVGRLDVPELAFDFTLE